MRTNNSLAMIHPILILEKRTEDIYSLVELDILKALKLDEKWMTFARRRGNRKHNHVKALTGRVYLEKEFNSEEEPDKHHIYF